MKIFLFFFCLLLGCADPKYLPKNSGDENRPQTLDCKIQFKQSQLCVDLVWEKIPSESEVGVFTFVTYQKKSFDQEIEFLDPQTLPQVILWMPSMSHGSSPVSISREGVGHFRAENVFFIMPGEWQIRFQIREGNTVVDEAVVDLLI